VYLHPPFLLIGLRSIGCKCTFMKDLSVFKRLFPLRRQGPPATRRTVLSLKGVCVCVYVCMCGTPWNASSKVFLPCECILQFACTNTWLRYLHFCTCFCLRFHAIRSRFMIAACPRPWISWNLIYSSAYQQHQCGQGWRQVVNPRQQREGIGRKALKSAGSRYTLLRFE
jgi:hypothetical protein